MKNSSQKYQVRYATLQNYGFNSVEENNKTFKIVTDLVQKRLESIHKIKNYSSHTKKHASHELASAI
jgi:hypothetical protein